MIFRSKNLLLSNIIFLLLLALPLSVKAEWIKNSANPILKYSDSDWDSLAVRSPAVINDSGQLKLYFQGQKTGSNWQIGLAYSSDGITWSKESLNPILTPSNSPFINEVGLEEPTVLKDSLYRMWYKSDPTSSIRYATSTDGITWDKYEKTVLTGTAYWENRGVANPSVIFKDGQYWMYYTAWGIDNGWMIGLATSTDGIVWEKYSGNPLNLPLIDHFGRPAVIFFNNKFHLFYHTGRGRGTDIYHLISDDGINFACDGTCSILKRGPFGSFDYLTIIGPAVVEYNSQIYLYYSGTTNDLNWQIGLATEQPIVNNKIPIIILPGMFSSWHKESILHNQPSNQSEWILNPIVKEYDGLTQTLANLSYQKDKDYYLFNYDWRKNLNSLSDDLNNYIQQLTISNPTIKFNILGHSLGGLVGRIYLQKFGSNNVNKLITIGSPHLGTANTYTAVEAGELNTKSDLMWLGQKIILQLNKNGLKTDKQVINEIMPIAKDLLPTYDYLKNQNDQIVPISSMQIKNDLLLTYNNSLPNTYPFLQTIYGEKGDTIDSFKITSRTMFDQLLDLYPDGRPSESLYSIGDTTVTNQSASIGNNSVKMINYDHGEIVYKKESVKKILDSFSISYLDSQITEGMPTEIFPSLIFLILSPATLKVEYNNQAFNEQEGIVYIKNAQVGQYSLKVTGQNLGRYTVIVGQIINNQDNWFKIEGEIKNLPQIDNYSVDFKPIVNEAPIIPTANLFDEIILYLTDLNKTLNKPDITSAIKNLNTAKSDFSKNNFGKLKSTLLLIQQQLFLARSKVTLTNKQKVFYAIEKIEGLYGKSLGNYQFGIFPSRLQLDITAKKKLILPTQKFLLTKKNAGKDILKNSLTLLTIDNKLKLAEENFKNKNYNSTEILLKTIDGLLKEVRIL